MDWSIQPSNTLNYLIQQSPPFDKENDALYFRFDEHRIVESEEVEPGVILD